MFTDFNQDSYSLHSPAVAEAIAPYPGEGLEAVRLIERGSSGPSPIVALAAVVIGAVGIAFVIRRRRGHKTDSGAERSFAASAGL